MQRDVSRHRADCTVTRHVVAEGDDEHVYIDADIDCTGRPTARVASLSYRLEGERWRLFHIAFDTDKAARPDRADPP